MSSPQTTKLASIVNFINLNTKTPLEISDQHLVNNKKEPAITALNIQQKLYKDTTINDYKPREISNSQIRFAYKIYSKVYPIVATLVFIFIWNGKLKKLANYYSDHIQQAKNENKTLVDIGVGDGSLTKFSLKKNNIKETGNILFVDLSSDMLSKTAKLFQNNPNAFCLISDVNKLAIEQRSVDHISCYGALHVFPEPGKALKHMQSLLTENGIITLSILTQPSNSFKSAIVERFVRTNTITSNFTHEEVKQLFAEANLTITDFTENGHQVLITAKVS